MKFYCIHQKIGLGQLELQFNVFCNMSYCEGSLSEFIRVASFDKSNKNESCAMNLTEIVFNGSDYCGLQEFNASCSSVYFSH